MGFSLHLSTMLITLSTLHGCLQQDFTGSSVRSGDAPAPNVVGQLPLKTNGRFIVDNTNKRFKLKSVNWYGASDDLHVVLGLDIKHRDQIADTIKSMGFNSVRLPFSNEMLHIEDPVAQRMLLANPDLIGKNPLEVFDAVIDSLASRGLLIILNNHTTKGQWCCSGNDNDGLWYNDAYSESQWLNDWLMLVKRYKNNSFVIGADLRNEPRRNNKLNITPQWGGGGPNDWKRAAELAGNAILDIHPDLLIIVEGLDYSAHLRGAYSNPLKLKMANRLVYSFHSYSFFKSNGELYDVSEQRWGSDWGYLLSEQKEFTAPVWVSEFGTGRNANAPISSAKVWWNHLMCYLQKSDIDFAYWALNGTKLAPDVRSAIGGPEDRAIYQDESYGLLDNDWNHPKEDWRMQDISAYLMPTRQGPGIVDAPPEAPCVAIFGGRNGEIFDQSEFANEKLSRIRIKAGDVIDSISFTYDFNSHLVSVTEGGEAGSQKAELNLDNDEYLTEMQIAIKYYKGSQTVAGLRFGTNKRPTALAIGDYQLGEKGSRSGFENFTYKAPKSHYIAAFKGRSGHYIDSLGPIYRKYPDQD